MRWWFYIGFAVLWGAGCEQPVDLGFVDADQRLVVISNFSDVDTLEVVVALSESVLDTSERPTYIADAQVDVFRRGVLVDQMEFVPSENEVFPSFYRASSLEPQAGETYSIRVTAPGLDPVEASDYVPSRPEIDTSNLTLDFSVTQEDLFFNRVDFTVKVVVRDSAEEVNFYHLNFYQEGFNYRISTGGDTLKQQFFSLPLSVAVQEDLPVQPYLEDRGFLFDDQAFNGQDQVFTSTGTYLYRRNDQLLGNFVIELRAVSENYFKYHASVVRQYQSSGDPLADPVILFSNIQGGYGIFAGYNARFYALGTGE